MKYLQHCMLALFLSMVCGIVLAESMKVGSTTLTGTTPIDINATNFPDANFRSYLLSQSYGSDGILTADEINGIISLVVSGKQISRLKGIEYFTALEELYCYNNKLTTLDVSKNTALEELYCLNNQLATLDVSKNTVLEVLSCNKNQLTTLDVSKNTALTHLGCSGNRLTTLDISKNTALFRLDCDNNQLTALDLFNNTALTYLVCSDNQLTTLDVSKNTALEVLSCDKNQLTTLDVSKNTALTYLDCSDNQLTTLDVSKNTVLTYLECYSNQISGVNMDHLISSLPQNNTGKIYPFYVINTSDSNEGNVCTKSQVAAAKAKGWRPQYYDGEFLRDYNGSDDETESPTTIAINATNFPDANFRSYLLSQSYGSDGILTADEINGITNIDVLGKQISNLKGIEYFTALEVLSCHDNQLTTLDVSNNTALTTLICNGNQLTTLDVSNNTALKTLYCEGNQLTTLDVSKNTKLNRLYCEGNQLTTLDVSKNTALTTLYCNYNQLATLDVSKNTALRNLYCSNNQLTALDVSKHTALFSLSCGYNQLTTLDVSKNTALNYLVCSDNQLTTLDVSKNTALDYLQCDNTPLTALDVSKNTALTGLLCYNNQLTTLDLSKNTALYYLSCNNNQLTTLDVSENTALKSLNCYSNQISGVNMDHLISSLPQNGTYNNFAVVNTSDSNEGNVCTKTQVAAAKAKGWRPQYYDGEFLCDYNGSDENLPTSITHDGVNYEITSFDKKTVSVASGAYGMVLTVPASFTTADGTWQVTGIVSGALSNNSELAAIIWNPEAAFTENVSNPNLLLYVWKESFAPSSIQNVVVNNVATSITLQDAYSGNNFFCPQEFTAQKIDYTHNYSMKTGIGESRGWETLALPFDVQKITHSSKGEIVPFAIWQSGSNKRPFWLMELGSNGFKHTGSIKANTPYIISMPNHPNYKEEARLNGRVTFSAEYCRVKKSEGQSPVNYSDRQFWANFYNRPSTGCFALNVNNSYVSYNGSITEGSRFMVDLRPIKPFEAYMTSTSGSRQWFDIDDFTATGIGEVMTLPDETTVTVYNLQGQLIKMVGNKTIEEVEAGLPAGVYIVNGRKMSVK